MVGYISDNQTPQGSEEAANMGYLEDSKPTDSAFDAQSLLSSTSRVMQTHALRGAETPFQIDSALHGNSEAVWRNTGGVRDDGTQTLPKMSADYINNTYGPIGFDGKPTKITEGPVPDEVGKLLGQRKKQELDAQDTWSRYSKDHSFPVNTGVGMAAFMTDYMNASTMFIPGIGEETALAGMTRAGLSSNIATRSAARLIAGGTAGAAGTAPLTAIKYGSTQEQLDNYGLKDAFKDMAYGAAGNAVIHAGVFGGAREAGLFKPDHIMLAEKPSRIDPTIDLDQHFIKPEEPAPGVAAPAPEQPYNIFTPEGNQIKPSDKLSDVDPNANPDASLRTYNIDEAMKIMNADAQTKHAALTSATSQLIDGRPIDVADIFPANDGKVMDLGSIAQKQEQLAREGYAQGMTADELEAATHEMFGEKDPEAQKTETKPEDVYKDYVSQAQAVKDEIEAGVEHHEFDQNNLHHVQKALGLKSRPKSILNFIREKGGISLGKTPEELAEMKANGKTLRESASGELKGIFDGDKHKNAFYSLIKKSGRSLDELAAMAREAGYFHEMTPERQGEMRGEDTLQSDDLLPLIEKELNGERHYTAATQQGIDEMFGPKGMRGEGPTMGELIGAEKGDSVHTIAKKLHEYYKPSEDLAAIHAADAEHTPVERAEEVADLMSKERNLIAEKQLPGEYDAIHETPKSEIPGSESTENGGRSEHDAAEGAGAAKPSKISASGSGAERKSDAARATGSDGSPAKPTVVDDEIAYLQDKLDKNKMTQDERQILADSEKEVRVAEAYRKGFEAAADCLVEVGA